MASKKNVVIKQYHESVASARKRISHALNAQHDSLAKDYGADYKLGGVKLAKGTNPKAHGRRLYDITLVPRKNARAHRPFRSRK